MPRDGQRSNKEKKKPKQEKKAEVAVSPFAKAKPEGSKKG